MDNIFSKLVEMHPTELLLDYDEYVESWGSIADVGRSQILSEKDVLAVVRTHGGEPEPGLSADIDLMLAISLARCVIESNRFKDKVSDALVDSLFECIAASDGLSDEEAGELRGRYDQMMAQIAKDDPKAQPKPKAKKKGFSLFGRKDAAEAEKDQEANDDTAHEDAPSDADDAGASGKTQASPDPMVRSIASARYIIQRHSSKPEDQWTKAVQQIAAVLLQSVQMGAHLAQNSIVDGNTVFMSHPRFIVRQ